MSNINNYPSDVIKMNFSESEQKLFRRHCLTGEQLAELHNQRLETFKLIGKIERVNLDLLPYELD